MNARERRRANRDYDMIGEFISTMNACVQEKQFRAYPDQQREGEDLGWQAWIAREQAATAKRQRMAEYARKHNTAKHRSAKNARVSA